MWFDHLQRRNAVTPSADAARRRATREQTAADFALIIPGGPARRSFVAFGLFAFLVTVYVASPMRTPYDSRWSVHTAMSLIEGQGGDLTDYLPVLAKNNFYCIEYPGGRPHTVFPIGVSLLSAPIVAALAFVAPSFKGMLRETVPQNLEKVLASIDALQTARPSCRIKAAML